MKALQTTYRKWSFRVVDGVLCDVLVTALMVDKSLAERMIGRPELADYSTWVINRGEKAAWPYGPYKGY